MPPGCHHVNRGSEVLNDIGAFLEPCNQVLYVVWVAPLVFASSEVESALRTPGKDKQTLFES